MSIELCVPAINFGECWLIIWTSEIYSSSLALRDGLNDSISFSVNCLVIPVSSQCVVATSPLLVICTVTVLGSALYLPSVAVILSINKLFSVPSYSEGITLASLMEPETGLIVNSPSSFPDSILYMICCSSSRSSADISAILSPTAKSRGMEALHATRSNTGTLSLTLVMVMVAEHSLTLLIGLPLSEAQILRWYHLFMSS